MPSIPPGCFVPVVIAMMENWIICGRLNTWEEWGQLQSHGLKALSLCTQRIHTRRAEMVVMTTLLSRLQTSFLYLRKDDFLPLVLVSFFFSIALSICIYLIVQREIVFMFGVPVFNVLFCSLHSTLLDSLFCFGVFFSNGLSFSVSFVSFTLCPLLNYICFAQSLLHVTWFPAILRSDAFVQNNLHKCYQTQ